MGDSERDRPGRRINVVGTTGSGKTTAAREIAERLGMKCIELDALFWKPNWGQTPDDEFLPAVEEATRGDDWVVDGNYSRTRCIVWPRADTIVWLDYSFPRVFAQLLWRTIRRSITKEELWSECRERVRVSFFSRDSILVWCLQTYWKRRRNYPEIFARPGNRHLQLIHLRTPRETAHWLRTLRRPTDGSAQADASLDLTSIREADMPIETIVRGAGEVVRAYHEQDSGCVSYILEVALGRLFVKAARTDAARESLLRAEALHEAIRSPTLPRLLNTFGAAEGPVHVYEWVPGEILYDYVTMDGERGRADPSSSHARFRKLPVDLILGALAVIYDLHVQIARAGFVAVDFYDGCILHDFDEHRTWVCDLDEYRPGPFTLDAPRLPGSRRFMAPEEFVQGSVIDQRTNVYTLGRTAAVLLSDGDLESDAWRGTDRMRDVLLRATAGDRDGRYESVSAFVRAWREASV